METKEMTKEQALEYLKDTKIFCTSTEESRRVQEKLLEIGIKWQSGERTYGDVYLLLIENKKLEFTHDIESWIISSKKRIEPAEILTIQLKEEEPKFDPKILQPFDKVLVRDGEAEKWRGNLFCHINEAFGKYYCVFDNWKYCIPYNDETKHLIGTANEEPEFYRI